MKFIRYGKYVGEPADAVDLEELIKRLGNFFLQSGFESQFYGVSQMDPERSMEALREAILRALQEGDLLPENAMSEELRKMLQDPAAMNSQAVKDLLDKLTERLANEGFINPQQPPQVTPPPNTSARGRLGQPQDRQTEARFEITDKTIDFLGFKTLQDLLGSLGHAALASHSNAVSRRHAKPRSFSRFRRRSSSRRTCPRAGRPVLHQHTRRPAHGPAHPPPPEKRHAPDRHDH